MTIRMPFPDDVNPEPSARFKRTLAEAFPCNAAQAVAVQSFPARKHPGRWLALALLVLIAVALAGCSPATASARAEAQQRAIPAGVCPDSHVGVWIDSTTIQCLKELP